MSSILVFIKPYNDHPDPAQDWKRFKAGDVIDVHSDDDMDWGSDVQGPNALGWWMVVTVPDATKVQLDSLIMSEPLPYESIQPSNIAEVPRLLRTWALDVNQLRPSMTFDELMACASQKPALVRADKLEDNNGN